MNDAAVKTIAELAVKADRHIKPIPGVRNEFYYFNEQGEPQFVVNTLAPQTLELLDLQSLLMLATGECAVGVLVGNERIVLVQNASGKAFSRRYGLDDSVPEMDQPTVPQPIQTMETVDAFTNLIAEVRWSHALPLRKHPAFVVVEQLVSSKDFTQHGLVKLFRTTLAGFVDADDLSLMRNLRLDASDHGVSQINNGDQALSRRVTAQVRSENGLKVPDEITLRVPVYDLAEERNRLEEIRVVTEAAPGKDGQPPVFTLTAVHNDVVAAEEAAQLRLVNACRASFPFVLRGKVN